MGGRIFKNTHLGVFNRKPGGSRIHRPKLPTSPLQRAMYFCMALVYIYTLKNSGAVWLGQGEGRPSNIFSSHVK